MSDFDGKHIIIAGAATGIGRAAMRTFTSYIK